VEKLSTILFYTIVEKMKITIEREYKKFKKNKGMSSSSKRWSKIEKKCQMKEEEIAK